jgi:diaminobutyrate-2-oxoglutarate transaminase
MTRSNVAFMPYDGYFGNGVNTIEYIRKFLDDPSSGVDKPAAMILETVQAEGGVNVASYEWLVEIQKLCHEYGILFIVDDIQVGNGRTGTFFSFERAGIRPDIITLSKSIGGGLPLSLVLIKPELDQWKPGEHTGTFRGNNLAFVASAEALTYWDDDQLAGEVDAKSLILKERLEAIRDKFPQLNASVRGRGLIYGLQIPIAEMASEISTAAFHRGLIIELAGARDDVVKFLPSLTIEEDVLKQGLDIIEDSIAHVIENWGL